MRPTSTPWTAIGLVLIGGGLSLAWPVAADDRDQPALVAAVSAAVSEDGALVEGVVVLTITNNSGVPVDAIPLWLYPNRFREPGPGLSDRTVNWIYPVGQRQGGMTIAAPEWNGTPLGESAIELGPMPEGGSPAGAEDVVARIGLPFPLRAGERGSLTLQFRVRVPKRRGRFGRFRGVTALAGGWFPRPFTDLSERDPGRPPEIARANIRLALPAGRGAVVLDQVYPFAERAQTIEATDLVGEDFPLVVMERMEVTERRLGWGTAIFVSENVRMREPTWKDTRGDDPAGLPRGLPRVGTVDVPGRALDVAETTASLLLREEPSATMPERLVIVEIPAMDRLVQSGPGIVLVSDRLWRLITFDAVLAFHDQVLARELGAELGLLVVGAGEPPAHRHLVAELIGSVLGRLYIEEVMGGVESVQDLIGIAGFLPRVDNLLYSPQVPFREAYSPSIEEEDPLRDEPWRFMNALPRGRRLAAKLEDLIGEDRVRELVAELLGGRVRLVEAVRSSLGEDGARRFYDQWLADYPSVNYRLGDVSDERLADGRVRHLVRVHRDGARIVEPVTVRITDGNGESHEAVWDGQGSEGLVEWISDAPVDTVRLDPDQRLVEDPALTSDHPLADNMDPLPWRPPLLTRFVVWGDALTLEPHVDVSFAMRQKYDITNSYHLAGSYTPRGFGGLLAYLRHFGSKRTLNSRIWYAGPTASVFRYHRVEQAGSQLPKDSNFAATMGSFGLLLGRDDREYFYDPRSGMSFDVGASYSVGQAEDERTVQAGGASTRAFALWSPGIGHTFALYGGAVGVVGEPVAADLASLSTRNILRGFAIDETYGRVGFYAVLEYRHRLFDMSPVSLVTFARLDRLQGVLFLGAGSMSQPSGYGGMFTAERVFTEAGYGIRLHMLSFGVAQYLIALDFAVPITPLERSYEVEQSDGSTDEKRYPPFKLVFGITQTY